MNIKISLLEDFMKESHLQEFGLIYNKTHKNRRGELTPWVIVDYETSNTLASFKNKNTAKKALKNMKFRPYERDE
jgi:hypothetical protein